MNKAFGILSVVTSLVAATPALARGTTYQCSSTLGTPSQPIALTVEGSYSSTGALQFPIIVYADGKAVQQYSGASGYASDHVLQLDGNRDGRKLELRHYVHTDGSLDEKNYLEFNSYKTKAVDCARRPQ
jgi:hypothetical protein